MVDPIQYVQQRCFVDLDTYINLPADGLLGGSIFWLVWR